MEMAKVVLGPISFVSQALVAAFKPLSFTFKFGY
jgi:hypothetical protein